MTATSNGSTSNWPRVAVIIAITVGSFFSVTPIVGALMGVYLKPISDEFGWTRSATAGALAALVVGTALVSPFVGLLVDRLGARRTSLAGITVFTLSILAIAAVPANLFVYYLMFFVTGAAGACTNTLAFGKILATWFDKSRGFWMGFCGGFGYGGGGFLFPLVAVLALESYGWRSGFVIAFALLVVVAIPILFLFLQNSPQAARGTVARGPEQVPGVPFRQAMRSPLFWWMASIVPLGAGCMTAMFSTIVPILSDRGVATGSAVLVVQIFALSTVFMQPVSGWIADRSAGPRILAPLFLLAGVGLIILRQSQSLPVLVFAGALMGAGAAAEYTMMLYFVSRYFGLKEFGAISGVCTFCVQLFGAIAPVALNWTFDISGSYDKGLIVIIAILIYSGGSLLFFPKYRFAIAE